MKKINLFFMPGIFFSLFLISAYFIPITVDKGANFITTSSLLAVIIFYNPLILAIYILIAMSLIIKGLR